MNHIVSVTFIPDHGTNVVLDKEPFLNDFIDKSEEVLDTHPVGCSIEVVYDHVVTDRDGNFVSVRTMRCVTRQKERGIFMKTIEMVNPEHVKSVSATRYRLYKLKKQFMQLHKH